MTDPRKPPPAADSDQKWVWDRYGPDSDLSMAYLLTPEAAVRKVLAAYYVRDCRHVVEIGGYKVPITKYLLGQHESVTVVDPQVDPFEVDTWNGGACRVRHLPNRYQDAQLELPDRSYGLVLLGLALRHFSSNVSSEWARLCGLARRAQVVVAEYCVGWEHAEGDYARLKKEGQLRARLELDMTLPEHPRMDPRWAPRKLCVLDPPWGEGADHGD